MDLGIGVGHGILNILLHKYFVPKGTFKICVIVFSTNSAYLKAGSKSAFLMGVPVRKTGKSI